MKKRRLICKISNLNRYLHSTINLLIVRGSRGRWHGEVMIHTYPDVLPGDGVTHFWEEVSKLSMIRHENVALFMGACIEPPHLAVITR